MLDYETPEETVCAICLQHVDWINTIEFYNSQNEECCAGVCTQCITRLANESPPLPLAAVPVNSYMLWEGNHSADSITLDCTFRAYDDQSLKWSTRWAIRCKGFALSVSNKHFQHEPLPSARSSEYLLEHRFTSAETAFEFWSKHWREIIAADKVF